MNKASNPTFSNPILSKNTFICSKAEDFWNQYKLPHNCISTTYVNVQESGE